MAARDAPLLEYNEWALRRLRLKRRRRRRIAGQLVSDEAINLFEQGGDDFFFLHAPNRFPFAVDHSVPAAGGNTKVGPTGFTGSVHSAAHHSETERHPDVRRRLLNLFNNLEQVYLQAAASRTRDYHGPAAS